MVENVVSDPQTEMFWPIQNFGEMVGITFDKNKNKQIWIYIKIKQYLNLKWNLAGTLFPIRAKLGKCAFPIKVKFIRALFPIRVKFDYGPFLIRGKFG